MTELVVFFNIVERSQIARKARIAEISRIHHNVNSESILHLNEFLSSAEPENHERSLVCKHTKDSLCIRIGRWDRIKLEVFASADGIIGGVEPPNAILILDLTDGQVDHIGLIQDARENGIPKEKSRNTRQTKIKNCRIF